MNRTQTGKILAIIGLAGWLAAAPGSVQATGIAMRFVDITLENVEPGAHFNLRVIRNLPLVVINQDDMEGTDIIVEAVSPNPSEMKESYEPIPNPNWIKIVPDHFHLGPKASASCDVVVEIPDDKTLIGHHYEAIIWAHTDHRKNLLNSNGVMIEAGLRTRFRMSIGTMGPASLQREKALKKLAEINANFSVSPDNLFVQNIGLGHRVDLKTENKAVFKIINESDNAIELKTAAVPADPNITPQAGYENAPDPKWLEITPVRVKVDGNSIKELRLKLTIPDKPEYHGKKYMILLATTLASENLPLAFNNQLYFSTAP